jgi:hypothetical protein
MLKVTEISVKGLSNNFAKDVRFDPFVTGLKREPVVNMRDDLILRMKS